MSDPLTYDPIEDAAPLDGDGVFIDTEIQDDEYDPDAPSLLAAPRGGYLDRSVDEAVAWGARQIDHPSRDWSGRCQMFVRSCYNVPSWAYSAIRAWDAIPDSQKYRGGWPSYAPRGAALYFRGGNFGHVMLATGLHNKTALSNDYVRQGRIDYCDRDIPRWNMQYLGWSRWTPFGSMKVDMPIWDRFIPPVDVVREQKRTNAAGKAVFRVACRLHDLGFYKGDVQPLGIQKYPTNAVIAFQKSWGGQGTGAYGDKTHRLLFSN